MKTKKRLLPALVFSALTAFAAPAAEGAQFSGVYVFGDSLSDAGFYRPFLLNGLHLPPEVVAQLGRFTTNPDPVWAELVSRFYGITPSPSNANSGNIFAQGGARVVENSASTPPGAAQRPVSVQINEFLGRTGGAADPNALYGIWAGANDLFQNLAAFSAGQITQAQLQANVLGAATAEIQQIGRLQAAGARYVLVFGLPDIGATPAFANTGATGVAVTQLSAGYNTTLFTGLASAGIRVIPVDVFTLFGEVRARPAEFGISNTTGIACGPFPPITTASNPSSQFCLPSNLTQPNANNTFAFADSVHPTGASHRVVAALVESLIEGPTQYSYLAEAPLHARESHIRTIADGLTSNRYQPIGKWQVWVAADRGKFDVDTTLGNTGVDNTSRTLSVGGLVRTSESVTLGLGIGKVKTNSNLAQDAGGIKTDEIALSLFGDLRLGGFYGTGVVSISEIDFNNITRNVTLGIAPRTSVAQSSGNNASAYFTAGYDFRINRFTIGPVVSVLTQNIEVNGFDEQSTLGVAGLRVGSQKRKSEVWSGGVRASCNCIAGWTPWLQVTADKERRDDQRFVTATPLTMISTNSSYVIPAYMPDTSYVTTSLGVNGLVTRDVALSVSYLNISGRSGVHQDAIGAMVSVRF
jgi:outer membrane lipase/esterase